MRLLMITADFPPNVGGMQAYSWELARAWARWATRLVVVAPRQPDSASTDAHAAFEVRRVRYAGDSFAFSATLPIHREIARLQPDAIFGTSWSCASGALLAQVTRSQRAPVFAAAHGRELILRPFDRAPLGSFGLQRGYDRLRDNALTNCRALFPVSRFTAGLLRQRGISDDRIEVVGNGVDPIKYQPMDPSTLRDRLGVAGKKVLLTIGRLVERKGIDTVLHSLPALVRDVPNLVYVIVGDGPDRARIEGLIAANGLASHVRLVGRVPMEELVPYYNLCDVFVMPARTDDNDVEGFGIVFVEASACGKPVVGARSGGVTDAVIENETGLLVEPNDVPALTVALRELLTDDAKAQDMGARGRRHVIEHGTWDLSARRIYDAIANRIS